MDGTNKLMTRTLTLALLLLTFPLAMTLPASATHYFLANASTSPAGSDANNGTSAATPWLSPNHALNCGDDITAVASTAYSAANFANTKWGTVTCAAGNDVAWVKCATFDACKITVSANFGMWMNKSFWGVWGWEVAETGNNGLCFGVIPSAGATIHHIIVANSICNGGANGFASSPLSTTSGVDYLAFVGDIAWNATQSTILCNSGFTVYEPVKFDSLPGTHIYIGGNFSFDNFTPTNCNGGTTTFDGNGIILDDWGSGQDSGTPYSQQGVVDNNLSVFNGGYGLGTSGNGTSASRIYFRQNTSYGNVTANNTNTSTCGDSTLITSSLVEMFSNLVMSTASTACHSAATYYALALNGGDATDHVYNNFLYSAAGNNVGIISSPGFSAGPNNTTGTNPSFTNPVDPGQPSCGSKASTVDCMSTVIANYVPATAAAKAFGYQPPTSPTIQVYDALYPQWLCNGITPTLLSGLITQHCVTAGQYRAQAPLNLRGEVGE